MHAGFKLFNKLVDKTGGIDFRLPVCMAYSGLDDSSMRDFMRDQATLFEGQENHIHYSRIGATVGTYSGPNAFAIGFFSN